MPAAVAAPAEGAHAVGCGAAVGVRFEVVDGEVGGCGAVPAVERAAGAFAVGDLPALPAGDSPPVAAVGGLMVALVAVWAAASVGGELVAVEAVAFHAASCCQS